MSDLVQSDNYRGYRHPFLFGIHYLGGVGDSPRTLTELAMSQFSWQIRRSSEWWKVYKDEYTRNKWTDDALNQIFDVLTPTVQFEVKLSRKQINYVIDELEGYDALRDGPHQMSCFERIWESHGALESDTAIALNIALDALASEAHHYNEDADDVATDVIDHKLYPLVYNRSLVPHDRLNGRVYQPISPQASPDVPYATSRHFAFLPSDIFVPENPSAVKFLSYINNLNPSVHQDTYQLLEKLLAGFVPLFEHTLTDLHRNNPLSPRISGCCRYTVWEEPEPPDQYSDDEEGWTNYESEMRQWTLNRPIALPDVPDQGYRGGVERRRHIVSLRNRTIQVIVNVSKIRLIPGGPQFTDSPWHVEGMRAERIAACGFYFMSSDNITETSLRFRMAVTFPRGFSAGDTGATLRTWGFRDGDSSHQYIGDVIIRPGLSLVFPNIYQHCQTSFKLADPSKEGHLKVVRFFLVDPDIKPIISTSLVAPQQKEWIHKAIDDNLDAKLPHEVVEAIMENVKGLMTIEEAKSYRKQMVEETDRFTQANNSYHFCIPFDIWNGPEP